MIVAGQKCRWQAAALQQTESRYEALPQVDKGRKDKRDEGTDAEGPDDSRQLRNQFNFSERAAQTFNYPMVDRGTTTEPPPTASMAGTCNQVQCRVQTGF